MNRFLLGLLNVPPEPEAPDGSPDSIRVFRAGRNYLRWRIFTWAISQFGIAAFFVISSFPLLLPNSKMSPTARSVWVSVLVIGGLIWATFAFVSLMLQKLNFEQRWYIVTDRSLRIRTGIWSVQEITMTFANIQDLRIARDPLQLILGISDLRVSSAGGGGGEAGRAGRSSHNAVFSGVEDAEGLRDLIVERLRRYRDAGLGDPEKHAPLDANAAAAELLAEARALRAAVTR